MNIAVIGVGGVGGYFGGKLTQILQTNPQVNIFFIARNQHLKEIQANGLLLDSDEGKIVCKPTKAIENISELPQLDYCLICVKGYDLENVLKQLKVKIGASTVILPLLNGVDIYERVREVIKTGYLHPACVYVGTHIEKPGIVKQRGGACTIILGNDPEAKSENTTIIRILDLAKIKYKWLSDPFGEIWSKFIFIGSFGLVTANFDKSIGEAIQSEKYFNYAIGIIKEIVTLAERKGIDLPSTIVEDTISNASKFPFETKTSFQRDFELKGKPDERDLFGGSIIRMGKELRIPTTITEEIYSSIMRQKPIAPPWGAPA